MSESAVARIKERMDAVLAPYEHLKKNVRSLSLREKEEYDCYVRFRSIVEEEGEPIAVEVGTPHAEEDPNPRRHQHGEHDEMPPRPHTGKKTRARRGRVSR